MDAPQKIAVAVVHRAEEVLIGLRSEGIPLAGYWEFPGGKVKPGESYEAAARRECQEETGLRISVVKEYPGTTHPYKHATVELRFFHCIVDALDAKSSPMTPFQWVPVSLLSRYEFPEANAELLRNLTTRKQETGP